MIREDYVSFETAKLLKEKGFNPLNCGMYYSLTTGKRTTELLTSLIACPTHQMTLKWLREVHNIDVCVCRELDEYGNCFNSYIAVVYSNKVYKVTIRDIEKDLTYEEAVEAAIKYCLTNLI